MGDYFDQTRTVNKHGFYRKMLVKRFLHQLVGEVYVGRRAKLVHFQRWMDRIQLAPTARILEAGSGDGLFSFWMAKKFPQASVTGLELNRVEAEVCQRIAVGERLKNLTFVAGDLCGSEIEGAFDFIFCLDVLEHIPDDLAVLKGLHTALVEGGTLLVHVPHRSFLKLDGELLTVPDEEAWKFHSGHVRSGYSPQQLTEKLQSVGFKVLGTRETQGPPVTRAFQLYSRVERVPPARLLILPFVDRLIREDVETEPVHGNTVWGWAKKTGDPHASTPA